MSDGPSPLLAPETRGQIDLAKKFDGCLVALEAFLCADTRDGDRAVEQVALFRAYATRLGALIATAAPTEEADLLELVSERVAESAAIMRLLRS